MRGSGSTRRVLYIAGWGRSGSTLLDLMLGQHPGVFSAGELREIWERGLQANGFCGCRKPFRDCPFWTEVGDRAFDGWYRLDLPEVLRLRRSLDRAAAVPGLLARGRGARRDLDGYTRILGRLLDAIREASGADVVADSSKTPSHALLLRRIDDVDIRMVHLVRDSRGVAYSFQRGVDQRRAGKWRSLRQQVEAEAGVSPEDRDDDVRRRLSVPAAAARWFAYNSVAPSLRRAGIPYLSLRYEDLVANPGQSVSAVLRHADVDVSPSQLSFIHGSTVRLGTNHTVYGSNRLRFLQGDLPLRLDEEWRSGMSRGGRGVATALTFPLLLRHGYRIRASGPSDAEVGS